MDIFDKKENNDIAETLNTISAIYRNLGEIDKALEFNMRAYSKFLFFFIYIY